jgi:small subunit ribosomal protein S6
MNYYELLYIVQPTSADEELKATMDDIAGRITKAGGEILRNEVWQKRNLAYPIKKFKQGYYVLVHYKSKSSLPKELEERLRIKEDVLRFMTTNMLKKDIAAYEKQKNQETQDDAES